MRRYGGWLVMVLLPLAASGCGGGSVDGPSRELLVSAAASLTDAFGEIEAVFEATHPQVDVVLNLGGSSTLRAQVLEGAPADVFASADPSDMEPVVDAGLASDPQVFAHNGMQIAVPAGNPADITGLTDLARPELFVGLCAEEVPCGDLARQALARAGVAPSVDTNEPDVRALLTKIEARELDAGVTYVTDVLAAGDAVDGVDIPADVNVHATYPIVVLEDAPNPETAAAFVELVLSERGQAILQRHGFTSP